jgi:hypothetical protein
VLVRRLRPRLLGDRRGLAKAVSSATRRVLAPAFARYPSFASPSSDWGFSSTISPVAARTGRASRARGPLWYSSPSVALAAFPDTRSSQPTLRSRNHRAQLRRRNQE